MVANSDPTPRDMGELVPVKFRCWRQNLKMVAQRTQTLLQDKDKWRYNCAHPERGEAEDIQGLSAQGLLF
jgi:hypothetical protein